jgi:hypothetical protein
MRGSGGKCFEDTLDFSWNCLGILSDELRRRIVMGANLCVIDHTGTAHCKGGAEVRVPERPACNISLVSTA